jgi:transcriptional regulator with XRE-family HTH domain
MKSQNPVTQFRKKEGMTRIEMARRSGVSYPTLTVIENGMCNSMKERTVNAIAEFAKCSPSELREEYRKWKQDVKQAA